MPEIVLRIGGRRSQRAARLRVVFRERFCPYDVGHAADRVMRWCS